MKIKRNSMRNVFVRIHKSVFQKYPNHINRFLGAALATGAVMGLEGHVWYSFLDRLIVQRTWRNVLGKTFLDQIIVAPFYTLTYIVGKRKTFVNLFSMTFLFQGTSILEGRASYREVSSDTQRNFLPLYLVDCAVYVPIQIINFKYIPAFYRVPFLSLVAFVFDIFISAYKHQHEGVHIQKEEE